MSFTYTQTQTNPTFGTLNLKRANLLLDSLFNGRDTASIIFTSNNASNTQMLFGPDASVNAGNVIAGSHTIKAPTFQASTLTAPGGILTTDASGLLTQDPNFKYLDNKLTVRDMEVTGNLVVNHIEINDMTTVLIEDPIVQVGLSNIMADQDVGFIFTANASTFGSNVALGFSPTTPFGFGGPEGTFVIGRTDADAGAGGRDVFNVYGDMNVGIYGNLGVSNTITCPIIQVNGIKIENDSQNNIKLNTKLELARPTTSNLLVLNNIGGITDSGYTISTLPGGGGGGSQDLQSVLDLGATADTTMSLTNAETGLNVTNNVIVGGNVFVGRYLTADTLISESLNSNTASFDVVNVNKLQVADIHANGDNINFYGPSMNVAGNLFAATFHGDGSALTNLNITSNLQSITVNGATSDRTVSLTNATTGLSVTSNASVGGTLSVGNTQIDEDLGTMVLSSQNGIVVSGTDHSVIFFPNNSYIASDATLNNNLKIKANSNLTVFTNDGATSAMTLTTGGELYLPNIASSCTATRVLGYSTSGEVTHSNTLSVETVISNSLNANTAALNLLNLNTLQVADIHANGGNINFYGPRMNVSGNITSASLTTGVAQATGVLAQNLNVTGSATFDGVATVSVLKFSPGGIDPEIASPAVSYSISSNIINLTATGVTYGSATVDDAIGQVKGVSVTGLSPNAHLYIYVQGSQTFVTPTDGLTYLSTPSFPMTSNAVYHIFNIGGKIFVDLTKVN